MHIRMYTQYVILFFYSINIFHNSLSLCLCHHHHSSTNGPTNQYTGPPTTAAGCSSAETVTCKLLENTQISMSLLVIHNIFLSSRLVTVIVYCLYILFLICWLYVHHCSSFFGVKKKHPTSLLDGLSQTEWLFVPQTQKKKCHMKMSVVRFFENNRNYVLKPLPRADPQCFSHFPYGNAWVCMRACVWNIR